MSGAVIDKDEALARGPQSGRRQRADAQRNVGSLLEAAAAVFAASGVDAPVREIADRAGVGVGTVYRHFPQRAELVAAVFRREIDACADAAQVLAGEHPPFEALARWLQRYADFIAAKRGLAKALHSGDPTFDTLPAYFDGQLRPALRGLLAAAVSAGQARTDVEVETLLHAVARLCISASDHDGGETRRMVALLSDGLRTVRNT